MLAGFFVYEKNLRCAILPAMKRVRFLPALLLFVMAVPPEQAMAQKAKTPPAPSVDLLLNRSDSYWNLMLQRKKSQAVQYISASDRELFLNSAIPQFSNPRFKSLELSDDRTQATITVVVRRVVPALGGPTDWPVTEEWRFEKGTWYRRFVNSGFPVPEDVGFRKPGPPDEIHKLLRIETPVLDFGTVRGSQPVKLSLKYSLAGDKPLSVKFKVPSGFDISGARRSLAPGKERELIVSVPTYAYDGPVNERIILEVRRPGGEVSFEVIVKGNVYIPASVTPKMLTLNENEPEQEIRIRNNSQTNIELRPLHTESGQVAIESLPSGIAPGQEIVLKVKLDPKPGSKKTPTRDNVVIPFKEPVDGLGGLSLTVDLYLKPGDPINILLQSLSSSGSCKSEPAIQ